ncbi:hypothetical protein [Nocardia sp. NPDC127526]|uniref:hypothetical protein n=1 Tax=Nocardia sp. NPDC127526 TaxID=3345393 RepID=UPI003630D72F
MAVPALKRPPEALPRRLGIPLVVVLWTTLVTGIGSASPLPDDCVSLLRAAQAHNREAAVHNANPPNPRNYAAVQAYNAAAAAGNARGIQIMSKALSCTIDAPATAGATRPTAAPSTGSAPSSAKTAAAAYSPPGTTAAEAENEPIDTKINSPEYRAKYLLPDEVNGVIRPRNNFAIDENGMVVPPIRIDPSDPSRFITVVEEGQPPGYVPGSDKRAGIEPIEQIELGTLQDAAVLALHAITNRQWAALIAQRDAEITTTGRVSPETAAQMKEVYDARSQALAELGTLARQHMLRNQYPRTAFYVEQIDDPVTKRRGGFDSVYEIVDKASGGCTILIIAEKGPGDELNVRPGAQGLHYQEGTRGYLDATIEAMTTSESAVDRALANRLTDPGTCKIEYVLVRALVTRIKVNGVVTNELLVGFDSRQFRVDEPSSPTHVDAPSGVPGDFTAEDLRAIDDYISTNHWWINRYNHDNHSVPRAEARLDLEQRSRAISTALAKLPPYTGVVLRGINLSDKLLEKYKPGAVILEPAFTSSSIDRPRQGNTQFTIESRNGKYLVPLGIPTLENEVLFDRGTRFEVLTHEIVNGVHHIRLRERA